MDFKQAILTILLIVTLQDVCCINWKKFQTTPPAQFNFNATKYVGSWYFVARRPSCTCSDTYDFTNHVAQYSLQKDGVIILDETFRSSECTTIQMKITPNGIPGTFVIKDTIGDPVSGPSVIVATDYKSFVIKWGCNKPVGDICQDPYIVVKSRRKTPSAKTWKIIEMILDYFFEISLAEMIIVNHDGEDCVKLPPYRKKHHPR